MKKVKVEKVTIYYANGSTLSLGPGDAEKLVKILCLCNSVSSFDWKTITDEQEKRNG